MDFTIHGCPPYLSVNLAYRDRLRNEFNSCSSRTEVILNTKDAEVNQEDKPSNRGDAIADIDECADIFRIANDYPARMKTHSLIERSASE